MIVDIRDTSNFQKNGILGSINIPERHIKDNIEHLKTFDNVVFVCYAGTHSRRLAHLYSKDLKDVRGTNLSEFK